MTNASIDTMLSIISRSVNTLSLVASDIDLLLDLEHIFTARRDLEVCRYYWDNTDHSIRLYIAIHDWGGIEVYFRHPLLAAGSRTIYSDLNAPDLNQAILLHIGQCCHKPKIVCPLCGL